MFSDFQSLFAESTHEYINQFAINAPKYFAGTAIILVFWLIARLQKSIAYRVVGRIESKTTKTTTILIARVTRFVLLTVGFVIGFTVMGVDWNALVTGLGLVGFGVSFAFRDYIENFLAGVIILTQNPFSIGDQVRVKDVHGIVEEIATRYTVIKDFDGKQVILPNAEMLSSSITRDNAYGRKRYSVDIDIDIDADVSFALAAGLDLVRKTVGVLTKPNPRAVVSEVEDGKVNIVFYFWAHPREEFELSVRSHLHRNLLNLFHESEISIGYPTSRVLNSKERRMQRVGGADFDEVNGQGGQQRHFTDDADSSGDVFDG